MRPHSPSSLSTAKQCPFRWYRERVAGDVPRLTSAAAERGTRIHNEIEAALHGEGEWPASFPHVEQAYGHLRVGPGVQAERAMALDRDMQPTDFDGPGAWLRGIADLLVWEGNGRLVVVDWKSGKRYLDRHTDRPKSQEQMDVYTAMAFIHSEAVLEVETRLEWLVPKKRDTAVYTRVGDMRRLVTADRDQAKALDEKVERLDRQVPDKVFRRNTNGLCRDWCPVTDCSRNGGASELFPRIRFKRRT